MDKEYWLVNSNRSKVKKTVRTNITRLNFSNIFFIDSRKIPGVYGREPSVIKNWEELKINEAREEWKKLLAQRWKQTKVVW